MQSCLKVDGFIFFPYNFKRLKKCLMTPKNSVNHITNKKRRNLNKIKKKRG